MFWNSLSNNYEDDTMTATFKLTYNICNIAGNAHNNTSDAGNKKFHSTDPIVLPGIIKDFSKI
jgi:hypothetical protein